MRLLLLSPSGALCSASWQPPTAYAAGCILPPPFAADLWNPFRRRTTESLTDTRLYSNLPSIASGWITLISFNESNPKAGKRGPVTNAVVGTMVDVAVPVPDVVDGGGGVYPSSPDSEGLRVVLGLRNGAQRPPHLKFRPSRSGIRRDRLAARRRRQREDPLRRC